MNDFRKLEIWQLSKDLSLSIYKVTELFPDHERFGLINQIRRCAISIPSNIAEGSSRTSKVDFNRFITIALGSAYELDTQLEISYNLHSISKEVYSELNQNLISLKKMLFKFSEYLSLNN